MLFIPGFSKNTVYRPFSAPVLNVLGLRENACNSIPVAPPKGTRGTTVPNSGRSCRAHSHGEFFARLLERGRCAVYKIKEEGRTMTRRHLQVCSDSLWFSLPTLQAPPSFVGGSAFHYRISLHGVRLRRSELNVKTLRGCLMSWAVNCGVGITQDVDGLPLVPFLINSPGC